MTMSQSIPRYRKTHLADLKLRVRATETERLTNETLDSFLSLSFVNAKGRANDLDLQRKEMTA
jgi:hypothetical protein